MPATTTAEPTIVTITSRSRNLGIGWTNQPVRRLTPSGHNSYLTIAAPSAPGVEGSRSAILRELERARRTNSGNEWTYRLFVGGRPIEAFEDTLFYPERGANVEYEDYYERGEWRRGWRPANRGGCGAILEAIGGPHTRLRVRLAAEGDGR